MPKKIALCIGLNYPGTDNELSGCVNDATDWATALEAKGFVTETLLEPDLDTMRRRIGVLVSDAERGDTAVLTYSGHGSYVADTDGDEPDGRDEVLCPADVFAGAVFTDDELARIFQSRVPGVRLVFISDSCHSGTVARFAFNPQAAERVPKVRFLPPAEIQLPRSRQAAPRSVPALSHSPLKSSALLLSDCMDWEYSYDAWFGDRPNGAMSRAAIDALKELGPKATYRDWFKAIRQNLPTAQYPQSPNLYGTSDQKRWKALQ